MHCGRGQENVEYRNRDVAYANMVACYPGPGSIYVPLGALFKASWPSLAELHQFVSPRSRGCERRFTFSIRGKISAARDDTAAAETIKRIGLDNRRLEALRKEAIDATLNRRGGNPTLLDLASARRRLTSLEEAENAGAKLEPFCFALSSKLCTSTFDDLNRSDDRRNAGDPDHGQTKDVSGKNHHCGASSRDGHRRPDALHP